MAPLTPNAVQQELYEFVTETKGDLAIRAQTAAGKTTLMLKLSLNNEGCTAIVLPTLMSIQAATHRMKDADREKCVIVHHRAPPLQRGPCQVVISTPDSFQRALRFVEESGQQIHTVVLDEVDLLVLEQTFRPSIQIFLKTVANMNVRLIAMSATGSGTIWQEFEYSAEMGKRKFQHLDVGKRGFVPKPNLTLQYVSLDTSVDVQKARAKCVEKSIRSAKWTDTQQAALVFVREMTRNNTPAAFVVNLVALLQEDYQVFIASSANNDELQGILEAMAKPPPPGKLATVVVATSIASRVDVHGVALVVMAEPASNSSTFFQQMGRTGRGLNEKANVVIVMRREDTETYLRNHIRMDKSLSDIQKSEMEVMADAILGTRCHMAALHWHETGEDMAPCEACPQCEANRSALLPCTKMTRVMEVVSAALAELSGLRVPSVRILADYLVGTKGATGLLEKKGSHNARSYGGLRDTLSRSSTEKVIAAALSSGFLMVGPTGLELSDQAREWYNQPQPRPACLFRAIHIDVLTTLASNGPPIVGEAARVSMPIAPLQHLSTMVKNMVGALQVVHVPPGQHGESSPLYNPECGQLLVVQKAQQPLLGEDALGWLQFGVKRETRLSTGEQTKIQTAVQPLIPDINLSDGSMIKATCRGVLVCQVDECSTIDNRARRRGCPNHEEDMELVKCGAAVLLISTKTVDVVIALNKHAHRPLPPNKVPPGVEKAVREYARQHGVVGAAELDTITVAGVNGGQPMQMVELFPRLGDTSRVAQIVAKNGRAPDGYDAAVRWLKEDDALTGDAYFRGVNVDGNRVVLTMAASGSLKAVRNRVGSLFEVDGNHNVVRDQPVEPGGQMEKWYEWAFVTQDRGKVLVVFRAILNGKSMEHYHVMWSEFFRTLQQEDMTAAQVAPMIGALTIDWEASAWAGCKSALAEMFGTELGVEMAKRIRGCLVHFTRIIAKRKGRYGQAKLWKKLALHAVREADAAKARAAFALLEYHGQITPGMLAQVGLEAVEAADVDWRRHGKWVRRFLSDDGFLLKAACVSCKPEAAALATTNTNLVEASHVMGGLSKLKQLPSQSSRKTLAQVVRALKAIDMAAERKMTYMSRGVRLDSRAPESLERRKNREMMRREKRGFEDNSDDDDLLDAGAAQSANGCRCKKPCDSKRCLCKRNSRSCSALCKCVHCKNKKQRADHDNDHGDAGDADGDDYVEPFKGAARVAKKDAAMWRAMKQVSAATNADSGALGGIPETVTQQSGPNNELDNQLGALMGDEWGEEDERMLDNVREFKLTHAEELEQHDKQQLLRRASEDIRSIRTCQHPECRHPERVDAAGEWSLVPCSRCRSCFHARVKCCPDKPSRPSATWRCHHCRAEKNAPSGKRRATRRFRPWTDDEDVDDDDEDALAGQGDREDLGDA